MQVSLSNLFRFALSFCAVLTAFLFFLRGEPHPYIDLSGLFLILSVYAVLFAACGKFARDCNSLLLVVFTVMMFVGSRLTFLIFLPESFLGYRNVDNINFNQMVGFFILGTICCLAGCYLGQKAKAPRPSVPSGKQRQLNGRTILFAYCALMVIQVAISFTAGFLGATGSSEGVNPLIRYSGHFVNPGIMLYLYLSVSRKPTDSSSLGDSFVRVRWGLVLYVLYSLILGSRGSPLDVGVVMLCYLVCSDRNPMIKLDRYFWGLIGALGVFVVFLYPFTTFYRELVRSEQSGILQPTKKAFAQMLENYDLESIMDSVSYRVNLVEPLFYTMYGTEVGMNDVSDLVNVSTSFYSTLNRIIPGKQLGDILFTEYAYGFIYMERGVTYSTANIAENYTGYQWGMYGICYQLWGYFGGLVAIFVMSALIGFAIGVASRSSGNIYIVFWFHLMVTLTAWVGNLGLDNLFDRTFKQTVILCLYVGVLSLFSKKGVMMFKGDRSESGVRLQRLSGKHEC